MFPHLSLTCFARFLSTFIAQANKMTAGDPLNTDTTIGATITKEHAEKVLGFVQRAIKEGAKVECGGERIQLEGNEVIVKSERFADFQILIGELSGGYYLSPCILTNCQDSMEVVREEVFGSVACVLPFDTEEEVIKRANDTQYGLAGKEYSKVVMHSGFWWKTRGIPFRRCMQ